MLEALVYANLSIHTLFYASGLSEPNCNAVQDAAADVPT